MPERSTPAARTHSTKPTAPACPFVLLPISGSGDDSPRSIILVAVRALRSAASPRANHANGPRAMVVGQSTSSIDRSIASLRGSAGRADGRRRQPVVRSIDNAHGASASEQQQQQDPPSFLLFFVCLFTRRIRAVPAIRSIRPTHPKRGRIEKYVPAWGCVGLGMCTCTQVGVWSVGGVGGGGGEEANARLRLGSCSSAR